MDPSLLENIQVYLEESKEELANLLQRLIRIRSYSGQEKEIVEFILDTMQYYGCLLYTSPSPRDRTRSRMPSSA